MTKILFAVSALTLMAAPALAQSGPVGTAVGTAGNVAGTAVGTAGTVAAAPFQALGGGMGMGSGMNGQSCVNNGQFVPCQQPMMNQGMGMDPRMDNRRMSRREMRAQRRMMQQQGNM